jgi:hypothetical protein
MDVEVPLPTRSIISPEPLESRAIEWVGVGFDVWQNGCSPPTAGTGKIGAVRWKYIVVVGSLKLNGAAELSKVGHAE